MVPIDLLNENKAYIKDPKGKTCQYWKWSNDDESVWK